MQSIWYWITYCMLIVEVGKGGRMSFSTPKKINPSGLGMFVKYIWKVGLDTNLTKVDYSLEQSVDENSINFCCFMFQ